MKKVIIFLVAVGFVWALAHGRGAEIGTTGNHIASAAGAAANGFADLLTALFA